jgi:hypothetical protein
MNTSNSSQSLQRLAVPSLPPSQSSVSTALQCLETFLKYALVRQELTEQTFQPLPFLVTPTHFSEKCIYTPIQDWNGYR